MSIPKRNMHGLQDILTHSGKVDQLYEPYKIHMRISHLEMEKIRRNIEKRSAMHRVKNIDKRFQEIEAEKEALLGILDQQNNGNSIVKPETKTGPCNDSKGFRLKY